MASGKSCGTGKKPATTKKMAKGGLVKSGKGCSK